MSDYATTEKEKIFKEKKIQSIKGVCALILYWILHENFPKSIRLIVTAVVAFCGAAIIKLALVHFFNL